MKPLVKGVKFCGYWAFAVFHRGNAWGHMDWPEALRFALFTARREAAR